MKTVKVSVPVNVLAQARNKLGRRRGGVEEFLTQTLVRIADDEAVPVSSEMSRKLREAVHSPSIPVTDEYWEKLAARFLKKHAGQRKRRRSA